jgi:hypothetical protein
MYVFCRQPIKLSFIKKKHLHTDILKFYLVDDCDLQQDDFDLKRTQASTICRLVTQLKTIVGHYPDEQTFQKIINKNEITLLLVIHQKKPIE